MEQTILFEEDITQTESAKPKKLRCKIHRYARESDFVDHVIKKTGKIVKRCSYCLRMNHDLKQQRVSFWVKEKEVVSDLYVRTVLASGKVKLPHEAIPQELVEMKREAILLKREIDNIDKPLCKCKIHGDLFKDDVLKQGKRASGKDSYRCKECYHIIKRRHYENNKEKILAKHAQYRADFPEIVKATRNASAKRSRQSDLHKDKELRRKKELERKTRADLSTRYIKKLLTKRTNLKFNDLPKDLVDCAQQMAKLKREIRISFQQKILDNPIHHKLLHKVKLNVKDK